MARRRGQGRSNTAHQPSGGGGVLAAAGKRGRRGQATDLLRREATLGGRAVPGQQAAGLYGTCRQGIPPPLSLSPGDGREHTAHLRVLRQLQPGLEPGQGVALLSLRPPPAHTRALPLGAVPARSFIATPTQIYALALHRDARLPFKPADELMPEAPAEAGKVRRKAWFYWQPPVGSTTWNMQYTFRGHLAVLVNAHTASDGEAFAEGCRRWGLGKIIGTRTWGANPGR